MGKVHAQKCGTSVRGGCARFVTEDVVHHGLECCGGVTQAEEHYSGFVQPTVGGEGGFPFITLFDPNIVEAPAEVQSGEPLGFT